jgi:hypothetical protein
MAAPRAQRYFARAPRYRMSSSDIRSLRVVRKTRHRRDDFDAEVVNISETGLAFEVNREYIPKIGEVLLLEFTMPGGQRVAWYGRVVRIEMPNDRAEWKSLSRNVLVGLQFHQLPGKFKGEIRQAIETKLEEYEKLRRAQMMAYYLDWALRHWKHLVLYVISALATLYVLWAVTRPSADYDPKHPGIWGERKW